MGLDRAYTKLKVMAIQEIPCECIRKRTPGSLLVWRTLFFDNRIEMHHASCPLDPCECDAYIFVRKAGHAPMPPCTPKDQEHPAMDIRKKGKGS